ncbi:hypothetical protein Tco_0296802 [Tanacetum coccineum]
MDTQASSSHGFKKIKLTIIPPKKLFVDLTSDNENLSTPSPTTTSSSLTPPNAPSKTTSTKETTSSHENTSSSFQSKLQVIPSLAITLSLSPITPLENLLSPSSPSPPPPQPPIMGHPLYYNYHGSTSNLKAQLVGNEVVRVKIPKFMSWLDAYDKSIGDLDMIKDKVDNPSPQSTPQVLLSFEVYTSPVTYLEEVEETLGTLIEVEPLDETHLEDLGLNTCNHDIPLSSREVSSFDEPRPQPQPS